jgi:hypothetical protein
VKKVISIGVALALLAMVVVPLGVAAYTPPETYAKVPFAIVQSGFELIGEILDVLPADLGLPSFVNSALMDTIGSWAGGPLSWSVDMLGWGLGLVGTVLSSLAVPLGLPDWIAPTVNTIACQLFAPFGDVVGPVFDPCG